MVFPGDSEIGLDLITGVLRDGTWIFIFPVVRFEVETFHLLSNPDAFILRSTGHVRPADINVCDWHLTESLEFGSLNGVHNNDAFWLNWRVVASTDGSEMSKGHSPCAGTQIILVGKPTNKFGVRGAKEPSLWTEAPSGTWQDVERV